MARQRYNPETGEFDDDPDDQLDPNESIPPPNQPSSNGNEYPGATTDRQGSGGAQEADNRRVRQGQADTLNKRLGVDPGNIDSFLSGRNTWEGYLADQTARVSNTPGGSAGPRIDAGGGGSPNISEAYGGYLNTPTAASNQNSELTGLVKTLVEQAAADRARQDQERAAMREIMMGRLKTAQEPVSADSPGIRELISARRLESQRGSERQRQVLAERMAAQNLGDSGAMDAGVERIEQNRSEADSGAVAEILGGELQSKRQEVMQLLQMAAQLGDTEAARTLQAQMSAIDAQIQQQQMADVNSRFGADLGFRKSSFMDDLSYKLLALQLGANQNAGSMFL